MMTFTTSTPQLPLTGDERAYVEYSLFSAIRSLSPDLDVVQEAITVRDAPAAARVIACAVHIDSPAGAIAVRGTGDRLFSAVDTAARRLTLAADARLGVPLGP